MTEVIGIFIADDQADVRSALGILISEQPDLVVCGQAQNVISLIEGVCAGDTDIVLIDWELSGEEMFVGGIVPAIKQHRDGVKVVAMSGLPGAQEAAMSAGADAFVSKGDAPERLLAVLREVANTVRKEG